MSELSCIIIEDEPLAVRVLQDYIHAVPFLELKESFKDAILATDYLRTNSVDLMFLDIHLPRLKGMAFLKTLPDPPAVIITTAYHQYAIEGFDLNVADYLLKPFDFERFLQAVMKVKSSVNLKQTEAGKADKDYIFLTMQKKKVKILFSDIIYIESQREYIKIVTSSKEYISKMSTNEVEAMLPAEAFKRIHRSYIISVKKIDSYTSDIIEVSGVSLPIGRAYRDVIERL